MEKLDERRTAGVGSPALPTIRKAIQTTRNRFPHLFPTTLTTDEQRLILRATAGNVRDHTIISLALGTGLRLAESAGLDVGDVFMPDERSGRSAAAGHACVGPTRS